MGVREAEEGGLLEAPRPAPPERAAEELATGVAVRRVLRLAELRLAWLRAALAWRAAALLLELVVAAGKAAGALLTTGAGAGAVAAGAEAGDGTAALGLDTAAAMAATAGAEGLTGAAGRTGEAGLLASEGLAGAGEEAAEPPPLTGDAAEAEGAALALLAGRADLALLRVREVRLAIAQDNEGGLKRSSRGRKGGCLSAIGFPEIDDPADRQIGLNGGVRTGQTGCGSTGGEHPVADRCSDRINTDAELAFRVAEHTQMAVLQSGDPLRADQRAGNLHDLHQD